MLILFNGLKQKGFIKNTLKVFSLPQDCSNFHRFTYTEETKKISDEVIEELRNTESKEAIFILVDKDKVNGYKYYPVRKCKFLSVEKRLDKVYISVEYKDFVKTENVVLFTKYLQEEIASKKCPTKENDDNDSKYAIIASNIHFSNVRFIETTKNNWYYAVNSINNMKIFKDEKYIFYSYNLYLEQGSDWIEIKSTESIYNLKSKRKYKIVFDYMYPSIENNNPAKIIIKNSEGIKLLNNSHFYTDLRSNRVDILFETTFCNNEISSMSLVSEDVDISDSPILMCIKKTKFNDFMTILVLVFYAIFSFVAMEIHIDNPVTIVEKIINFSPNIMTSFILFILFKLNDGNKFL